MKKLFIIGSTIIVIILISWVFIESSKPLPGATLLEDEGREHVDPGASVEYKTNPPTSGKHFADWVRPGVYETPKSDGYLVHSLEHGYIIISYNCAFQTSLIPQAYAHGLEDEEESTTSGQIATSAATLSGDFKTDDCHKLVDQLIKIFEDKGKNRLIITPRPNLDALLSLTAWRRLEKWNPSSSQGLSPEDIQKIESFIDNFRNQGPEKTME